MPWKVEESAAIPRISNFKIMFLLKLISKKACSFVANSNSQCENSSRKIVSKVDLSKLSYFHKFIGPRLFK
jgi:hypothetical protein